MALKLSTIAAAVNEHGERISDTVSSEIKVRDKWLILGKTLYADGVRVAMLVPSTDKHPNDQADPSLIETITRYVIAGLSASKKGLRFDAPNPRADGKTQISKGPHMWTIADLLALTRDELRTIDDESLKAARRYWQQQVGTMFNQVRRYVDRWENPEKHRAEKEKEKAEPDAPPTTDSISTYLDFSRRMAAKINTIGLHADDAAKAADHVLALVAILTTAKAAADRLAK